MFYFEASLKVLASGYVYCKEILIKLLCRVALGKEKEVYDADETLPKSLGKFDSIKVC